MCKTLPMSCAVTICLFAAACRREVPEIPLPTQSSPVVLTPPEPDAAADKVRHDSIVADMNRLKAGEDWQTWQERTERYRTALRTKIDALKRLSFVDVEPLEGRDGFPLFELNAKEHLRHLYDPSSLDAFRRDRLIVKASKWLRDKGIDLIVVPVPKMTEVYIEHFIDPTPADGIIAPHLRRCLWELLQADVEVIDLFPVFRGHQTPLLFNTVDHHWSPREQQLAAPLVAERIGRYKFAQPAKRLPSRYRTVVSGYDILDQRKVEAGTLPFQEDWDLLTDEQRQRAEKVQVRQKDHVVNQDGSEVQDDSTSRVLLEGDSFVPNFREYLIRELNMPIRSHWKPGATTQMFDTFVEKPETLQGVKVIVWMMRGWDFTNLRPLPEAVGKE